MKKIIIIRGISGSGKTTFAKKLKSLFAERGEDCEICEADDYFTRTDGQYNFNPNLLSQAHNACYSKFVKTLENNKIAIVSNTSCKIWEIKKYIEYAKKNNIDFDVIYMDNYYGNVHGVPQNVIDSMKNRYEKYNGEILSNKYLENL